MAEKMNPLRQLLVEGQSFWYDNMRRKLLLDGSLKKLVDEDGLRGVTSNPTIFASAVAAADDYDADIEAFTRQNLDIKAMYERLVADDIRNACDILRPVYDASNGRDGFVSIEVSPGLARDTAGTIREVKQYWQDVDRPNLMVKIPGTREGLPAIEQSLTDGININITLLFSVERYIDVARAYVRALRLRATRGQPVDRLASVASFFVSRVDSKIDKQLDGLAAAAGSKQQSQAIEALKGKAAIANAKVAYERYKEIFEGGEFADLRERGAAPQRLLWASTSTKNPAYRDVLYVEELIGPETVDTMPPATIDAFRDHGRVARTLDRDVEGAHELLAQLAQTGIKMEQVTQELEDEGVSSFSASFRDLEGSIAAKRDAVLANFPAREEERLGGFQKRVDAALKQAATDTIAARVWRRDATVWGGKQAKDTEYSAWLGWLNAVEKGLHALDDLTSFVNEARADGISDAVVLGMGGSSLAPEVFRRTFGEQSGYPRLHVLDSTDPSNVLAVADAVDLQHTLFIVSSKSGTTTEPNDFFAYFWERVREAGVENPGRQFVAITDPGTPLESAATEHGFRRVFHGDPEIGGRYSALSPFGLVPAALAGVDLKTVLERARAMATACSANATGDDNPGLWLGTTLGVLAQAGHDKVTFVCSPSIESFGLWAEQLLAESTGKQGKGLIPIAGEELGSADDYGKDRVFVYLRISGDANATLDRRIRALERAGQPVVELKVADPLDLGAEFFRWEFATAVAGGVLGINPFDQPNVQESKDNTKALLKQYADKGSLPEPPLAARRDGVALVETNGHGARGNGKAGDGDLLRELGRFYKSVKAGDYLAIMAYLPYDPAIDVALQQQRLRLRDALKVATTLGYGPRFLHSTGQLHKGGPNSGAFVQITAVPTDDAAVPGRGYSFAVLEAAQALGDLQALEKHGRRSIRLQISGNILEGLNALTEALAGVGV
jgi:transaldolase / glucose-6-phosphate isomerase